MAFFRKKSVEVSGLFLEIPKKVRAHHEERSLSEIVHERVLTAEGWRRKTRPKGDPLFKKTTSMK